MLAQQKGLKKQAGLSFLGVFALVAMLGFIGLFAMKTVPGYIEFMTISKIVEDTEAKPDIMGSTKSKVLAHINQAYRQNNLWDMKAEDTIVLKKDGRTGFSLKVDYEKRSSLISNIFVVTHFQTGEEESWLNKASRVVIERAGSSL